ncbi:MAG TPA: ADP-ribosylglycohydrolase family protein [Myxococcales bacterium]|jgi:ADP-ribosylglycohydrolase|nr:ADP-ribosylglycohydrolase family protein [Myxococcales bacterium]
MALKQPVRRPPNKKLLNQPDPQVVQSRSRGALMGLAVGDALGATNELKRFPAPPFPEMLTGFQTEMKGGGPFQVKPGQVTDETQMACCIAAGIRAIGKYDALDVAKRYLAWRPHAFDVGEQIGKSLDEMQGGRMYQTAGKMVWLRSARQAATNGSLARAAPIGVRFAGDADEEARAQASLDDSALTHFDPRCQMACAALNGAIARAITQVKPLSPDDLVDGALSGVAVAGALFARQDEAQEFARDAQYAAQCVREDFEAARAPDPQLFGPELHLFTMATFVRVSFRLAFWELFHAPSFEAALIDVVNRGGDTDTNGAITGALLGAYHGAEQIPERWWRAVQDAVPAQRGPLLDLYHPNALLGLLDG